MLRGDSRRRRTDLKALARVTGDCGMELVPLKGSAAAYRVYSRGVGASAHARRTRFIPTRRQILHDRIAVSAYQRGLQLSLAPEDFHATGFTVAAISREKSG